MPVPLTLPMPVCQVGDIAACIGCLNCELICPDLALEVIPAKGGEEK